MQAATLLPGINWEAAVIAARAAVLHAEANGWRINVAVVDRSGNLMSFLRMPGAFLHSIDIAIDKAYTAASFGFSTKDWMSHIGHDDGMKFGFSARPRLVVFGGGLPIPAGSDWIGGIGVSGASEAEDEACARAGLAAIQCEPRERPD
jgi:uncharacterized protein GlcG (DUF336 family)